MCITQEQIQKEIQSLEARMEERFDVFKQLIIEGDKEVYHKMSMLVHKMSPETKKEIDGLKKSQEKIDRAIFGEYDDNGHLISRGMRQESQEMYKLFVQASGIRKFFNLIMLVGGVAAMLYAFFKKF